VKFKHPKALNLRSPKAWIDYLMLSVAKGSRVLILWNFDKPRGAMLLNINRDLVKPVDLSPRSLGKLV
jgi:hypothetical protein